MRLLFIFLNVMKSTFAFPGLINLSLLIAMFHRLNRLLCPRNLKWSRFLLPVVSSIRYIGLLYFALHCQYSSAALNYSLPLDNKLKNVELKTWADITEEIFVCENPKYRAMGLNADADDSGNYLVLCANVRHYAELLFLGKNEEAQRLIQAQK